MILAEIGFWLGLLVAVTVPVLFVALVIKHFTRDLPKDYHDLLIKLIREHEEKFKS